MSEFSRRVDVRIIKDEPKTFEDFKADENWFSDLFAKDAYAEYLEHFQPYRWSAVAANNEPIAHGESYFNEVDCINAVELLAADDTTMYWAREYGEDRGDHWLRYGVTDRNAQGDDSPEQAD